MKARITTGHQRPLEAFRWRVGSAAATDRGAIRVRNEDRFVCDDALNVYGVADGVGGLPAGADAAELAVTSLRRRVGAGGAIDLAEITRDVNAEVLEAAVRISPLYGMATTLTWGVFREGALHLAHVGDSRCYCLRDGQLEVLSSDHSVENEARQRRARGEFVVVSERDRNVITRCIGQANALEVDLLVWPVRPGDRYLFCTDGINHAMDDVEIQEIVRRAVPPEQTLRSLIALANARGGRDNATAVLVVIGHFKTP